MTGLARRMAVVIGAALLAGCQGEPPPPASGYEPRTSVFGPATMRIHPIFTQVKDWTGDGRADGIEVLLEFQDQFRDPTKAAGRVIFELYEYRRTTPDPRGKRLVNPWIGSLATVEDQKAHWNRTSRTYTFQLAYDKVEAEKSYLLTATFEKEHGGRFFDRVVVVGQKPVELPKVQDVGPATGPAATVPATNRS